MAAVVIKKGDWWEFTTNTGIMTRHVKSVTRDGTVSYINSEGKFCQCSMATFRRWTKGAEVTFREDWS